MKLNLPEFRPFDDDMIDKYDNGILYLSTQFNYNTFPFTCTIVYSDTDVNDGKDYEAYVSGFIGHTCYYNEAFVTSDDVDVVVNKRGKISKASIKKAYNTVVKQLRDRYTNWAKENIFISNKE